MRNAESCKDLLSTSFNVLKLKKLQSKINKMVLL